MPTLKESVQECKCAKCQIKKRAPEIYENIKKFMQKQVEHDEDPAEWIITGIVRIAQASRPFYFVTMSTRDKHHNCSECKSGLWTEMTCVIQESPGRHDLNLLPFVDIVSEVRGEES